MPVLSYQKLIVCHSFCKQILILIIDKSNTFSLCFLFYRRLFYTHLYRNFTIQIMKQWQIMFFTNLDHIIENGTYTTQYIHDCRIQHKNIFSYMRVFTIWCMLCSPKFRLSMLVYNKISSYDDVVQLLFFILKN